MSELTNEDARLQRPKRTFPWRFSLASAGFASLGWGLFTAKASKSSLELTLLNWIGLSVALIGAAALLPIFWDQAVVRVRSAPRIQVRSLRQVGSEILRNGWSLRRSKWMKTRKYFNNLLTWVFLAFTIITGMAAYFHFRTLNELRVEVLRKVPEQMDVAIDRKTQQAVEKRLNDQNIDDRVKREVENRFNVAIESSVSSRVSSIITRRLTPVQSDFDELERRVRSTNHQISQSMGPRRLSVEQQAQLGDLGRSLSKRTVRVYVAHRDEESMQFALQIRDALRVGKVEGPSIGTLRALEGPIFGIWVTTSVDDRNQGEALARCLLATNQDSG